MKANKSVASDLITKMIATPRIGTTHPGYFMGSRGFLF
jgi:hypothetical protein